MTRPALAIASIFTLFLAGCGADDGTTADSSNPQNKSVQVACQTSLPDAASLSGPMVLGFMLDGPAELIVMDARVDVEPDASALSVTLDEPERCGPVQHFDPIPLAADGTFAVDDVAIRFPHGTAGARAAEALVSFDGGFCTHAGSLQGTYSGVALSPTEKPVEGAWFISRVTDPSGIPPTCGAIAE